MQKSISQRFLELLSLGSEESQGRGILRGAAGVFILQFIGLGAAYVMQALLARWMGSRDFGDYIYAYNWARLLALFGGLGLTLSTLKFVPDYLAENSWGKLRGTINAFSLLTLAGSSILALAMVAVFSLFNPEDIDGTTLIIGLLITPLIALTYLYVEVLRGLNVMIVAYGSVAIGQNLLMMIATAAIFVTVGVLTNIQAILVLALVTLVIAIYQFIFIMRALPKQARTAKAVYDTRHWIRTSFPMLLIRGFHIIMERLDVLMIGVLLGAIPTGIYAVASRTANLTNFPMAAVNAVTAPRISPLYHQGKLDELEHLARRATFLSAAISLLIFAGLVIFSQILLSLFGEEYLVGQRTLIILGVGQVVNSSLGPVGFLMHLTDHQHISKRVFGVSMVINIILNVLLIPSLNIEGAAIATTTTMIIQNVWMYILVRKHLHINTLALNFRLR